MSDGSPRIQVVKVLVDPKRVAEIMFDSTFIQMISATRRHQGEVVRLLCRTLEHRGYTMEEITAAVEKVG